MTLTPEHHALRAKHIGGSEVASLFYEWVLKDGTVVYKHMFEAPLGEDEGTCLGCVGRHKTGYRLFLEKTGKLQPDPVEGERIDAGVYLESGLAAWAQKKWAPWDLRKPAKHHSHPTIKGFGCSRDYEEAAGPHCPVEFKNVDFLVFRDNWEADDDEIIAPPIDITLQCQHQLAGNTAPHAWLVACVGGNSLKRGRIIRHEPTIAKIETAVKSFWAAAEAGLMPNMPDMESVKDLFAVGIKDKTIDLSQDNEAIDLCQRYLEAKANKEAAEEQVDQIKALLAAKMGDHTRAKLAGGVTITWPAIHRAAAVKTVTVRELDYRGGFTVRTGRAA